VQREAGAIEWDRAEAPAVWARVAATVTTCAPTAHGARVDAANAAAIKSRDVCRMMILVCESERVCTNPIH
jgi:hypothetical protein